MRALVLLAVAFASGCTPAAAPSPALTATSSAATPAPSSEAPPSADARLAARLRETVAELDTARAHRVPYTPRAPATEGPDTSAPRTAPPSIRSGDVKVDGPIPVPVVSRILRQHFGMYRRCYEEALASRPTLAGEVAVAFEVSPAGQVKNATTGGKLAAPAMKACLREALAQLSFPDNEKKSRVTLQLAFAPPEGAVATSSAPASPSPARDAALRDAKEFADIGREGLGLGAIDTPEDRALPLPPPEGPWPIVIAEGANLHLGEQYADSTQPIRDTHRRMKVDTLYDALRAWRVDWKAKHSGLRFPGVAGLRMAPGDDGLALTSVVYSMAYAGFETVLLQDPQRAERIVELATSVPRASAEVPEEAVHLQVGVDRLLLMVWRGSEVQSSLELRADEVAAKGCLASRPAAASDGRKAPLVIHLEERATFEAAWGAIGALESCGGTAFWTTLSVR